MPGQTGLEQAGHSKFFKTFILHSWFLVISDLPERKKSHTFENLILTDKLFAIMVSKGMWKMDYHEQLQILYFMQWQEKILSVWLPKVFQSEQICLSPDIFWYSDWNCFHKVSSDGSESFWTSFAQKILNLFPSWKCFHVGASYVMMICINTYIE